MQRCPTCGHENGDRAKFCEECASPLGTAPAAREQRTTVTVLFCDVTGSTALGESTDPEALRALLARYFERMKDIVESHGGTVEKFIGDAVMAVFGVPQVHEDDALRAVRAATEMRAALPDLGVQARIGIDTGEVVTGTEERLATGDAVNVAARLEQAAAPGEILVGRQTQALVRDAVETHPLEPLELRGKADPVPAYRVVAVREAPERSHESVFVGRVGELETIRTTWQRAGAEQRCHLVTVVGDAGVGKSRLTAEFLATVDAKVVRGRCLPYGNGITYTPVAEVLKQLGTKASDPAAAASLRSVLGETASGASSEEIAWSFRKLLEEQAPLVCLFDDIQWGEKTFHDLVEHVALFASGAPLLLLCLARPELTERRPDWPVALRLEPLPQQAVDELMPHTFGTDLRGRIARAAGGNPLFVTEMVAMASESDGDVAVPPSLRALLAARLDQLETLERSVLERGAVEGEIFHRGAVQALADNGQVTPQLASLVRKGLIRPERTQPAGDDAFRFHHLLLRDAAYDALPKATRAELHVRLAEWLQHRGDVIEPDETLGYHLEQAARYRAELGQPDAALAERAAAHLAAAGRRALGRWDDSAAASLLERALELIRPIRLDVQLELDFASVFFIADPQRAAALAEAAADQAHRTGDQTGEALARVVAAKHQLNLAANPDDEQLETLARAALPLLEQIEDHAGLADVWGALGSVALWRDRGEDIAYAAEQKVRHARLSGQPDVALVGVALGLVIGPRPAGEALRTLDALLPENPHAPERLLRAVLLAMLGRFDEAWPLARRANDEISAFRGSFEEAWLAQIAELEGDHESAARYLRRAFEYCETRGLRGFLSTHASALGRMLCVLGRYEEAERNVRLGRELTAENDSLSQQLWRQAQALIDAASGRLAMAEVLAREACAIAEQSDGLNGQGAALCDLAEVLERAGRTDEAAEALEQALDRYERKQNLAMIAQLQPRRQRFTEASQTEVG